MRPRPKSLSAFFCTYNDKSLIFVDSLPCEISFYTNQDPKVLKNWNFFMKLLCFSANLRLLVLRLILAGRFKFSSILENDFPYSWLTLSKWYKSLNVTINSRLLPNHSCDSPMWHCWPRSTKLPFYPVAKCNQPEIDSIAVWPFLGIFLRLSLTKTHQNRNLQKPSFGRNIAKGTTDLRVEFCLPK